MSWTRVVLLEPVPPRMPTVAPEGMCRSMSERASFFASAEYLKLTFSKSIEPSGTSATASAGLVRLGCSTRTSLMRLADSAEMVSMT